MVTIEQTAVTKIKSLLADEEAQGLKLRIFVSGGGCSGFQYGFHL
jgi:iron-sulfur cluster insertion protein